MSNLNSTNEAVTVDHDDLRVFGNAFFDILNETTNGHADDTLPMAMALSVLDNGYGQSAMRLPIFSDMTSVVTPDMPIDDTTQDDDEGDFSEETFSTVSDLSFDESHVHDNGDDDDDDDDDDDEFDMDDEIAKITFDDDDDEDNEHDVNKDDDKTQTTQFSFDLSFLLDNNVNAETATPVVQQQTAMPMIHNTTTAVDTTASPVMAIIDLTDDETDTPHDKTVHTPIPVETAIPAAPMEIVEIPDDDDDDNNNNNSTTLDAFAHDVMYAMDVAMDNLDNMRTAQLPAMNSIVAR